MMWTLECKDKGYIIKHNDLYWLAKIKPMSSSQQPVEIFTIWVVLYKSLQAYNLSNYVLASPS